MVAGWHPLWEGDALSRRHRRGPPFEPPDSSFDYEVPIEAKALGEADLLVRVVTYFCNEGEGELCRFEAT